MALLRVMSPSAEITSKRKTMKAVSRGCSGPAPFCVVDACFQLLLGWTSAVLDSKHLHAVQQVGNQVRYAIGEPLATTLPVDLVFQMVLNFLGITTRRPRLIEFHLETKPATGRYKELQVHSSYGQWDGRVVGLASSGEHSEPVLWGDTNKKFQCTNLVEMQQVSDGCLLMDEDCAIVAAIHIGCHFLASFKRGANRRWRRHPGSKQFSVEINRWIEKKGPSLAIAMQGSPALAGDIQEVLPESIATPMLNAIHRGTSRGQPT